MDTPVPLEQQIRDLKCLIVLLMVQAGLNRASFPMEQVLDIHDDVTITTQVDTFRDLLVVDLSGMPQLPAEETR